MGEVSEIVAEGPLLEIPEESLGMSLGRPASDVRTYFKGMPAETRYTLRAFSVGAMVGLLPFAIHYMMQGDDEYIDEMQTKKKWWTLGMGPAVFGVANALSQRSDWTKTFAGGNYALKMALVGGLLGLLIAYLKQEDLYLWISRKEDVEDDEEDDEDEDEEVDDEDDDGKSSKKSSKKKDKKKGEQKPPLLENEFFRQPVAYALTFGLLVMSMNVLMRVSR